MAGTEGALARRRGATVVASVALAVTFVGGVASWRAVERVEDAEAASARARGAVGDLEAMIRARVDEAGGRGGFDGNVTTLDDDLRYVLDELVEHAGGGGDASGLADEVLVRDEELRADADADGPDERLVVGMDSTVRALERLAADATSRETDAAGSAARWTVAAALVVSSAAWAAGGVRWGRGAASGGRRPGTPASGRHAGPGSSPRSSP